MGVMQNKKNKTAPCIEFGNESLAACIFSRHRVHFFSGGFFVFPLDFYKCMTHNLCLDCVSNFRYGA